MRSQGCGDLNREMAYEYEEGYRAKVSPQFLSITYHIQKHMGFFSLLMGLKKYLLFVYQG